MLRHKNIDRICCWALICVLLLTCGYMGAAASGLIASDRTIGYESRLFDTGRVHMLDIVMDDWEGFLASCTDEEYVACHVVIDGESYKNVAIRAKGNTSLSSVRQYGNNRYSFKIEFDHYQTGKTYHGLDKLSLNNLIQDNTYMKDYFAYTLMRKGGAAAPLCSFVQISVNGEPWGLYLAVEGVEDSFLSRNYGNDTGDLYKPDSMSFGGGRGNGRGFDMDDFRERFAGQTGDEAGDALADDEQTADDAGVSSPDGRLKPGGMSIPEGMTPPDGMLQPGGQTPPVSVATAASPEAVPESTPETTTGASGQFTGFPAMPEGMTPPEGMAMPGGMPQPDSQIMPASVATAAPTEAASETTPETTTGASGQFTGFPAMPEGMTPPEGMAMPGGQIPPDDFHPSGFDGLAGKEGRGGGTGSSDVMLQYAGDDPAGYSNIFDNAKTDVSEADQQRLIASLKALSEGDTSVVDQDAVIRYLAVHNFLCNDDSYTGAMVHNYYLYEKDGVLSMLPWDYNLAFGGFGLGGGFGADGATSTVNQPIDSPVTSGDTASRPMVAWIFDSESTVAAYHEAYQQFITEAFDSGWFAQEIDRASGLIAPFVESDPTAFCTYEEFRTGVSALKEFCLLRARSVQGQLDGDIPSTSGGQRNTDALIDASRLNLSDMGSMGRDGFGEGNRPGGFGGDSAGGFGRGGREGWSSRDENARPAASEAAAQPEQTSQPEKTADPPSAVAGGDSAEAAVISRPVEGAMPAEQNAAQGQPLLLTAVCAVTLLAALWLVSRYRSRR